MMLADCSTFGSLSFLYMNVSGGEPLEVQDNVREKPTTLVTLDDNGVSITGIAV